MSNPVQKLSQNTFLIGKHTYLVGKCKNYLKKDLHDILKVLKVSYKSKDTNAVLCHHIDTYLKEFAIGATVVAGAVTAVQQQKQQKLPQVVAAASATASATPVVMTQGTTKLERNKLWYKKKWYDMTDCKKAFRDIKKEELLKIGTVLGIAFSAKATKEKLCDELRKASHKVSQQVVVQQVAPVVPIVPVVQVPVVLQVPVEKQKQKSNIFVDGASISLEKCASFDEPLLKALVKAVGTSFLKDKAAVCKRIQNKYKGATIHLYTKDFKTTSKATTPKKTKATTPKATTPKATTPKELDALKGLVYDAESDAVVIKGHTFYFGKCDKNRAYKVAHLHEMATALSIPFTKKETGKSLCHKIEKVVKTVKQKSKSPSPVVPTTPPPSPPKSKPTTPAVAASGVVASATTTAAAPLLPSPLKAMTADEIRQLVRKCLNLSK
jgi:hypothetical protein